MRLALRFLSALALSTIPVAVGAAITPQALDRHVRQAMAATGAKGIAVAVIDGGKVTHVNSWGVRNQDGDPLQTDTIMYGASLTKTVFAYTVMQLVDEGVIGLDTFPLSWRWCLERRGCPGHGNMEMQPRRPPADVGVKALFQGIAACAPEPGRAASGSREPNRRVQRGWAIP